MTLSPADYPPTAADIESAAVGCALHGTAPATAVLRRLRPDDLADTRHRQVLAAAQRVLSRGQAPDPTLVAAELRASHGLGGVQQQRDLTALLLELYAAVPLPANAEHYATAVLASAWRRRVWQAGARLQDAADRLGDEELQQLVAEELAATTDAARRYTSAEQR